MKNTQKGFVVQGIVALIALVIIGGGAYHFSKDKIASQEHSGISKRSYCEKGKTEKEHIPLNDLTVILCSEPDHSAGNAGYLLVLDKTGTLKEKLDFQKDLSLRTVEALEVIDVNNDKKYELLISGTNWGGTCVGGTQYFHINDFSGNSAAAQIKSNYTNNCSRIESKSLITENSPLFNLYLKSLLSTELKNYIWGNPKCSNVSDDTVYCDILGVVSQPPTIIEDTGFSPIITSLFPTSGPLGTVVEIKGKHLAGFENDLDAWIENSKGERGYLPGSMTSSSDYTTYRVTIDEKLCTRNTSGAGACVKNEFLTITPGVYKIYTQPWGKKSNVFQFTITDPLISEWKTHTDTKLNITFTYPAGWEIAPYFDNDSKSDGLELIPSSYGYSHIYISTVNCELKSRSHPGKISVCKENKDIAVYSSMSNEEINSQTENIINKIVSSIK